MIPTFWRWKQKDPEFESEARYFLIIPRAGVQ
jgi:hypothetical protein